LPALAEPIPAVVTPEQVQQAMAEAPLLTAQAAQALLAEAARRGHAFPDALDATLYISSEGFPDLDRATSTEIAELLEKTWSTGSPAEQRRIQAYVQQYGTTGELLSPEAAAAGRALFATRLRALPTASRERLAALFATALTTGITHRQQAEARGQQALLNPFTPVAASPSPTATASRGATTPSQGPAGIPASRGRGAGGVELGPVSGGPRRVTTSASLPALGAPVDRYGQPVPGGATESEWRARISGARMARDAAEKRVQ